MRRFFYPESIAIVGVPRHEGRFGGRGFLRYLLEVGYRGRIYPVNPNAQEIMGIRAYPNLCSIPEGPHLVTICVPAQAVIQVLEECARVGARHIHVFSSGFSETGTVEGAKMEGRVAELAKSHGLLIIGPNCMGPYCPSSRLTAWGAVPGMSGPLGVISQSGGLTQRVTEMAFFLGLGTDKAVSYGNGTVLEASDFLEYFMAEEGIRVIALYLESVRDTKRFRRIITRVCRQKPVILLKGGRSPAGSRTVASHTGAMAGSARIWKAFARQTGMITVETVEELMDAALALGMLGPLKGPGLFIVGGGGGNSVLHADICFKEGLKVSQLAQHTLKAIRERVPLEGNIAGNPLDMWRTFYDPNFLMEVLQLAARDPAVDVIVVDRLIPRKAFHTPVQEDATDRLLQMIREIRIDKPLIFLVDCEGGDPDLAQKGALLRAKIGRAGYASFPSMKRAAGALRRAWVHWSSRAS